MYVVKLFREVHNKYFQLTFELKTDQMLFILFKAQNYSSLMFPNRFYS